MVLDVKYNGLGELPVGRYEIFAAYPAPDIRRMKREDSDGKVKEKDDVQDIYFILHKERSGKGSYVVLVEHLDPATVDLIPDMIGKTLTTKFMDLDPKGKGSINGGVLFSKLAKCSTFSERRRVKLLMYTGLNQLNELDMSKSYRIASVDIKSDRLRVGLVVLGEFGEDTGTSSIFVHCRDPSMVRGEVATYFTSKLRVVFKPKIPLPRIMMLTDMEALMEAISILGYVPRELGST